MDLLENGGNDFTGIAEQGRHDNNGTTSSQSNGAGGSGGSNYVMADDSARFIKFPQSVDPLNLWAVSGSNRVGLRHHLLETSKLERAKGAESSFRALTVSNGKIVAENHIFLWKII